MVHGVTNTGPLRLRAEGDARGEDVDAEESSVDHEHASIGGSGHDLFQVGRHTEGSHRLQDSLELLPLHEDVDVHIDGGPGHPPDAVRQRPADGVRGPALLQRAGQRQGQLPRI